ncbi:hypothetical protein GWE18_03405 [Bradyrhizobium sp. CSA112]|uniref:hypothetical protein n=1 Tax=Bradyrhizobium sp. CSA112 TaxID=2699170 RepID=UPI0023B1A371|nr:hypothetical protein [Bradyrhizobium sp. CSA112]MDE5451924.1 hypothetical protein [Bradyrhizobium sp. CSA112]
MTLTPEEPYSVAKGYVQSAYAMMANPYRLQLPDDTTFFMAFHMLCGFAVELYLKAYLVHRGFSERHLKDLGHHLLKIRELCVSEGLHDSGADMLVGLLARHHKGLNYRYMKRETSYQTESLRTIFSAFSSLDRTVDGAIGASAARGKAVGGRWDFPLDGSWRFPE